MVLQSNQGLMDCGVQVTVVHHAMVKRLGSGSAERECRKPTARRLATVPLPHVELPAKLLVALLLVVDHVEGGPLGLMGRGVLAAGGEEGEEQSRDQAGRGARGEVH